MSNPSTPSRRSGRLAGTPTTVTDFKPTTTDSDLTYTWGPAAPAQHDSQAKRHYLSCLRQGRMKQIGRGKKDKNHQQGDEQQRFSLGDGVLVAVLGNDVGVGIITELWEQDLEDEDADEGENEEREKSVKLCQIRWCYRKQDLPTTMNSLKVADYEILYAFSASGRVVSSSLPLENLINVCSIIPSDRFKAQYPYFHPTWNSTWKIQLAIDSSDDSSSEDDDDDEAEGTVENGNAKASPSRPRNHDPKTYEKELKKAAKSAPPSINLHTSTGGFNLYKRAVPLVYFCDKAFDKFAKGGKGKSWVRVDWGKIQERGLGEGEWEMGEDVRVEGEEERVEREKEERRRRRSEKEERQARETPKAERSRKRRKIAKEDGRPDVGDVEMASTSSDDSGSTLRGIGSEDSSTDGDAEPYEESNDPSNSKLKRKRSTKRPTRPDPSTPKRRRAVPGKDRKKRERKIGAGHTISAELEPKLLPKDPYERALHLLHVGATPDTLPCRESEFVDVLMRVEEGIEGGGGGCLYIAGVPGTGKTATVHAAIKQLRQRAEEGDVLPFSYVEINGLKVPTPQHAYTVLWEAISGQKVSNSKVALKGLEEHFSEKGRQIGGGGPRGHTFVVLMDELDQLLTAKQDIVYNFFNWPTLRGSQLFVIAIANRMDLPQHLAAKVKSRLGLQSLLFQPYDKPALVEIVQSRLIAHPNSDLDHNVLQREAIELAAAKMAGTNGDARRVLDACRRAVEVTLENAKALSAPPKPVTIRDMSAVLKAMTSSPVAMFIKQCSLHQKMMLAAMLRCIRREGVNEISWRSVRSDHDNLLRAITDSNDILSHAELNIVFMSLIASHALTGSNERYKNMEDRKVALGLDGNEVGRVLLGEGDRWAQALAGM